MANLNFVYTDPVAAQQAVQMFQLEQAGRDALRRNATDNIRTFTNRDIAREQTSQQRAVTESQIAQRDRELNQNQRQFDARQGMLGEDLKLRREDAARADKDASEVELFNALQGEVTSQDPPTGLEFDARSAGMSPQRKEILNRLRLSTIKTLNDQADIAENAASRWNSKIQALKPGAELQRNAVLADFEKSKERQFLEIDPSTGLFRSLLRRPRADADMTTPNAPVGGPISIQDLRNRVRGLIAPPQAAPMAAPSFSVPPDPDLYWLYPERSGALQVPQAPALPPQGIAVPDIIRDDPPAPMRDPYIYR